MQEMIIYCGVRNWLNEWMDQKFTMSIVFLHTAKCFQDVQSHPPKIYTGGELDHVYKKEKEKFPQNFYPNVSDQQLRGWQNFL